MMTTSHLKLLKTSIAIVWHSANVSDHSPLLTTLDPMMAVSKQEISAHHLSSRLPRLGGPVIRKFVAETLPVLAERQKFVHTYAVRLHMAHR